MATIRRPSSRARARTAPRASARPASRASAAASASSRIVKVGLTQMACGTSVRANLTRQLALAQRAVARGAQIICTQELFSSQYFCQSENHDCFALAETIPGPSTDAFQQFAKLHGVVVVASLFEKRAAGLYHNTAAVIDADGSLLGIYRKMHIPDDPLFYEKFYFTPGDTGFRAWKTKVGTIGVLICWDQWYPEAARLTALAGAEIIFYPTAIGWHPKEKAQYGTAQHQSWEVIQRSHAVANGCYIAVANRIGHELVAGPNGKPVSKDGLEFWGQSFIASPDGAVVTRASTGREEVLVVACDLAKVEFARTHWPFLRDRRIDAYGALTERFVDGTSGPGRPR